MNLRAATLVVAVVCAIALARIAATHDVFSPTWDEPLHVAAGHQFVAEGRYAMSTDNPPLARAVFAFPLRHADAGSIGAIFESAGDYMRGVVLARRGNLLFVAIAILGVALFAARILGAAGAVLAAALFSLLPALLAHGGLATPDVAGTAAFAMSMFALDCWLARPDWKRTLGLGAAIALGLLTKFSFPLFFAIGAVVWMIAKKTFPWRAGLLAHLAALVMVYAVYLSAHAAPRFLIGLFQVLRNSQRGGEVYFMGELGRGGWWHYFPVIVAIKTPIAFLLLAIAGARKQRALTIMSVLMLAACMTSSINHGIRHLLPLYVPLSILAAHAVLRFRWLAAPLVAWLAIGSALAHPDYLPWMNALAGRHPERIVVDSNLDWGQDVLRLRDACRARGIARIGTLLFGTTDLRRIDFPETHPIDRARGGEGWYAVSETEIVSAQTRDPNAYRWLTEGRAFERVGRSIRLYRVTSPDAASTRPAS